MADARSDPKGCPPDASFVELVEGRITGSDARALHRHLESCSACRAVVHQLSASLASSGDEDAAEVARRLAEETEGMRQPGEIIGGVYRITGLLGEGGMGSVFAAEHTETGRQVAVKLINRRRIDPRSDVRARFRREAKAAGAIDSPHIVEIVDAGEDEASGDLFLVMEHLQGEDLRRLVDAVGPLRPSSALRVAAQALEGLERAHAAGIVHRDVTPANVFLARDPGGGVTVKLLDFGIAKIMPVPEAEPLTVLTATGRLVGSPLYMSPEQTQGSKDLDHRTDLWSLGSVLYYALTGRAPFQHAPTLGRLILEIASGRPPPLRDLAPWVSPQTAALVDRALQTEPSRRWPSAAAMLDEIRTLCPDGFELREDMLTAVPAEERAAASLSHHVVNPGSAAEVSGHEATMPDGSVTTASRSPRRTRLLAAACLVLASGVAVGLRALGSKTAPVESPDITPAPSGDAPVTAVPTPVPTPPPVPPETASPTATATVRASAEPAPPPTASTSSPPIRRPPPVPASSASPRASASVAPVPSSKPPAEVPSVSATQTPRGLVEKPPF